MMKKRHFSFLKCLFLFGITLLAAYVSAFSAQANENCMSAEQQLANVDEWVKIAKIIDGDTVHLKDARKIRFIGINTPEIGHGGKASQPFARQAHRALVKLLKGHNKIGLSYDKDKTDRYKRLLAYLILPDGRNVEQELLRQGLAFSITVPPNIKQIGCFRNIEKKARKSKLGLWQLPEMQMLTAKDVSSKTKGYRFITGTVSSYNESKKNIYLKFTPKLSIRIAKKDHLYFSSLKLKSLVGKKIESRGWVSTYRGRQSIHVRTAYNIKVID